LLLLNAQLDGIVALGLGAAFALWSRPYLAGLALGLTLVKPQLVLPLAAAVLLARSWKVLAAWAATGVALLGVTLALNPHWVFDWLGQTRATVQPDSRAGSGVGRGAGDRLGLPAGGRPGGYLDAARTGTGVCAMMPSIKPYSTASCGERKKSRSVSRSTLASD